MVAKVLNTDASRKLFVDMMADDKRAAAVERAEANPDKAGDFVRKAILIAKPDFTDRGHEPALAAAAMTPPVVAPPVGGFSGPMR